MKPTKHYFIHVYEDKDLLVHLYSIHNELKSLKEAKKKMMDQAHKDIVNAKYYFYNIVEQTMKSVEVYPSQEVTG